jgi:hypothetical protein
MDKVTIYPPNTHVVIDLPLLVLKSGQGEKVESRTDRREDKDTASGQAVNK